MAAKMAAGVAAAVAVTAVAAGDRRNGTVAAVAAVPERGVLPAERERGHGGAGVDGGARASGGGDGEGCDDWHGGGDDGSENGGGGGRLGGGRLARCVALRLRRRTWVGGG